MKIQVLGMGCKTCEKLYEATLAAVKETGVDAKVDYIKDMAEITRLGIMQTPALVVDGVVKAMGRAPKQKEIVSIIKDA